MSADIKKWRDRVSMNDINWRTSKMTNAMQAEIDDLRAALAAKTEDPDAEGRAYTAIRLRAVCNMLGLATAVPDKDDDLLACMFSVLGMVRRKIEVLKAATVSADHLKGVPPLWPQPKAGETITATVVPVVQQGGEADSSGNFMSTDKFAEWQTPIHLHREQIDGFQQITSTSAAEIPYWLCDGSTNHEHNPKCMEAKMGRSERCRFGTKSEHAAAHQIRLTGDFNTIINSMETGSPWEVVCQPGFTYKFSAAHPLMDGKGSELSDDEIADIYKATFEAVEGCARSAPKMPPLVISFGKAIIAATKGAAKP